MVNLYPIVKYESLMLLRTWKFWIVGLISLFFPFIMYIPILVMRAMGTESGWQGLDAFGPFMLFHHYNMFQIIMIVFFTNDFREKDRNALIDEVMNSRSTTNLEYILGKYLGVVVPIMILTICIIFILSVINRITSGMWLLDIYAELFIVLNVPALLFATAFIIFISALLRNTFVVFIISLGIYIGIIVLSVYKAHSFNQLWEYFDFVGTALPLFPSDLVGIINFQEIVLQRIFFIGLGGFFFALTVVLFYPRLHQSGIWAYVTLVGGIGCFILSSVIGYSAWMKERNRSAMRTAVLTSEYDKKNAEVYDITQYKIQCSLFNNSYPFSASAEMTIHKKKEYSSDTLSFMLNPGLAITRLSDEQGKDIPFSRSGLVVKAVYGAVFHQGDSMRITVDYRGEIDSRIVCLRRKDREQGLVNKNIGMLLPPSVSPDEPVLLTRKYSYILPETFWYPQLTNFYAYSYPEKAPDVFFTGEWSIDVPKDLVPIAPGTLVKKDSINTHRNIYHFMEPVPIDGITLIAGNYQTGSTTIYGINVQYYISPAHSDVVSFFSEVKAEVDTVLTDIASMITNNSGLTYPYHTLTYVEVPHTYQWFKDNGLYSEPLVQTEIVMIPENVVVMAYKRRYEIEKNKDKQSGGTERSDAEIKKALFRRIILSDMFGVGRFSLGRAEQLLPSPMANYWSKRVNIIGPTYPLYEYYFDRFLFNLVKPVEPSGNIVINFAGIYQEIALPEEVLANLSEASYLLTYEVPVDTLYYLVRRNSLSEIKPDIENPHFNALLMYKGEKVNLILQKIMTPEKFKTAVEKFVGEYSFKNASIQDFQRVCESVYGKPLGWFFNSWLYGRAFPGYMITRLETYKLKGGRLGVQYLVEAQIKNGEPDPGYITVKLATQKDTKIKDSFIEGNQELLFSFLVDDIPKNVIVDPIFSQNQGTLSRLVKVPEDFDSHEPFEGIKTIFLVQDSLQAIIVDDLDPGFTIVQQVERKFFRPRFASQSWNLLSTADGYGKYKFTVREKRRTTGQIPAQWLAVIPQSGMYTVQVFIFKPTSGSISRYNSRVASKFNYRIDYKDNSIPASLEWGVVPSGWNSIGTYQFTKGDTVKVQLLDEGDGWLLADAVRFIPVK